MGVGIGVNVPRPQSTNTSRTKTLYIGLGALTPPTCCGTTGGGRSELKQKRTQTEPWAISVSEAARRLGLGRTTVYRLIWRGELRAVKLGSRTLIPVEEVRRVLGLEGRGDA
ncbi:MAG: helix-turn-helix domain-containing protein [Thermus sp.]|uniref:helix-turn-helix domain-containing protein n=1 Tax=Thermus sp. TaxID=275 RepID=UPI003D12D19D